MTKRSAIKALEIQRAKLSSIQGRQWVDLTKSYIKNIFGYTSEQYKIYLGYKIMDIQNADYDICVKRHELFLDNCIEEIKVIGIQGRLNFLQNVKSEYLIAIFTFIVPALFISGTQYGKYLSDVQNIELKKTVDSLRNTRVSVIPFSQNTNADSANKTNKNKKGGK